MGRDNMANCRDDRLFTAYCVFSARIVNCSQFVAQIFQLEGGSVTSQSSSSCICCCDWSVFGIVTAHLCKLFKQQLLKIICKQIWNDVITSYPLQQNDIFSFKSCIKYCCTTACQVHLTSTPIVWWIHISLTINVQHCLYFHSRSNQ